MFPKRRLLWESSMRRLKTKSYKRRTLEMKSYALIGSSSTFPSERTSKESSKSLWLGIKRFKVSTRRWLRSTLVTYTRHTRSTSPTTIQLRALLRGIPLSNSSTTLPVLSTIPSAITRMDLDSMLRQQL
jgi:hypothetical protein